jgi:hypothetical protein
VYLFDGFGIGGVFFSQPGQGVPSEPPIVSQISCCDGFTVRVRGKPALPSSEELLNFVIPNPIVFLGVQHRNQNVHVRKQILEPFLAVDRDRVVETVAPFRKAVVERMSLSVYRIA